MAVSLGERGLIRGGSGSKLGGKYIYLILVGAFSLGRQCVAVTCNKKSIFPFGLQRKLRIRTTKTDGRCESLATPARELGSGA